MRIGYYALLALALALAACEDDKPTKNEPATPPPPPGKVEIVKAPPNAEPTTLIRREAERATRDGKTLLIYVGAPWCEPCQRFHKAAEAGQLDTAFPTLRLLEFDRDRDEARLEAAGCISRLIPLFAKPDAEGRCTAERIEGSIKGEGAVAEISPRLDALIAQK
jgi:thiol-disulfide isomerase/thioredoxin